MTGILTRAQGPAWDSYARFVTEATLVPQPSSASGPLITEIEPHGDLAQRGVGWELLPLTRADEPERFV